MMFNKIVKSGNENIKAVKTLDQVLKRRLELIPNLQKEIVRNYPEEENVSLNDIDSMREALSEKDDC